MRLFRLPGQSLYGLSADALVPCPPERPKYRTKVEGLINVRSGGFFALHQDYFIVTRNLTVSYLDLVPFNSFTVTLGFSSVYQDCKKHGTSTPLLRRGRLPA